MALASELSAVVTHLQTNVPPSLGEPIFAAKSNFEKSFDRSAAIKKGDHLPAFALANAVGKEVTSQELLAKGPILITFYRGNWCPFCNIALSDLQKHIEDFKAKGVTLVAISPEVPTTSLTTKQKHDLQFEVLSDVGNVYATKLGLLFQQPDELRPVLKEMGIDVKGSNGDDSFALPVAATILVDGQGVVRNAYVEPDWMKRLETSEALEWVGKL